VLAAGHRLADELAVDDLVEAFLRRDREEIGDGGRGTLAGGGGHGCAKRTTLVGYRAASDASLWARAMTALGRFALFCLRHAPEPDGSCAASPGGSS
jgi:hypothetical protein